MRHARPKQSTTAPRQVAATVACAAAVATAAATAFALAFPAEAAAQAICSAPHSSPTLAQGGTIGTLPAGSGWVQLSLYGSSSTEGFNPAGDRQAFIGSAEFDTRSAFLTASYGLFEGLEVWGQVPFHRLTVDVAGDRTTAVGVGDSRAAIRVSPMVLGFTWPVALRAGVKFAGKEFPVDAAELPLTEGQADFEVSLESGWLSQDFPIYAVGWVGYRWRTENSDVSLDPGDERFAHVAVGAMLESVSFELGLDGLWGLAPREQGLTLPSSRRRLIQLLPTVGTDVGPGRLELSAPIPVSGRNLPAGPGVSLGYRTTWGM